MVWMSSPPMIVLRIDLFSNLVVAHLMLVAAVSHLPTLRPISGMHVSPPPNVNGWVDGGSNFPLWNTFILPLAIKIYLQTLRFRLEE